MSKETTNYKLPRPEEEDFYNIEEYNHAIDVIDEALRSLKDSKLDKSGEASGLHQDEEHRFVTDAEKKMWNGKVSAAAGDISNTEIKRLTEAGERFPVPEAGENTKTFLGKVKKFIADFNDFKEGIITVGRLANNGKTTEAGFALDARYGKVLAEQVAGLSSKIAFKRYAVTLKNGFTNSDSVNPSYAFSFGRIVVCAVNVKAPTIPGDRWYEIFSLNENTKDISALYTTTTFWLEEGKTLTVDTNFYKNSAWIWLPVAASGKNIKFQTVSYFL